LIALIDFDYRTRYFSDSGIIGTREFVAVNYKRFKHIFQSNFTVWPSSARPGATISSPLIMISGIDQRREWIIFKSFLSDRINRMDWFFYGFIRKPEIGNLQIIP